MTFTYYNFTWFLSQLIESSSKQSEAALKAVSELGLLVRNSILQRNVDLSVQDAIPVEPNVKGLKRGRSIPRATSVSADPISSCDTDNDIQSKRRASSSVERKIVHESEPNPFSIQSLVSDLQHLTSDIRIGAQHGRQCIEEGSNLFSTTLSFVLIKDFFSRSCRSCFYCVC